MEYTLEQILDVPLLQALQDKLNEINPFPSALIDINGKVLTETDWQDICKKFHRVHPESRQECILSDQYIQNHLPEADPAVTYKCPHGLVDSAMPIVVEGHHLASFFTGQIFLETPDPVFFRNQAVRYGFEVEPYLEAVCKVPVWTREKLRHYQEFIKAFTESMAVAGLNRIREIEATRLARESENLYRTLVEQASDGIFISDSTGRYIDVNSRGCEMLGYTRDEILNLTMNDLITREETVVVPPRLSELRSGEHVISERRLVRKNGSVFPVEISAKMLTNGHFQGIVRDITQRKEAERKLLENELRFQAIIENTKAGYFFIDKDGVIADGNDSYADLYKYNSREEIIGLHYTDIQQVDDLDESETFFNRILTGDQTYFSGEFSRRCKDGSIGYHTFSARPVVKDGETIGIEGFLIDVTPQKMAEKERDMTSARLSTVFDTMIEGFALHEIICNDHGVPVDYRFLDLNPAFEKLTGLVGSGIIGKTAREVFPDLEQAWIDRYGQVALTGKPVTFEMFTGQLNRYYRVVAFSNQKGQFATIFDDITERKLIQEELIAAKERAEESDRLKSAFLANISHEIRTPMNSILGFTEILGEMITGPQQREYLKIISNGGERLLNIINSVIDIAKIEAGQENLQMVEFDVHELLRDLYELNKRRNPGVEFVPDIHSTQPFLITNDKTKLFQILNNLLSNALKFTRNGSVHFGFQKKPGSVEFYIKDTGIGIPDDFKSKVFDRFRKVDLQDRADFEGTGLGLAITSELVKILQGEIWFDSKPGMGTSFFVRIPV